jgi:hypothetical protein
MADIFGIIRFSFIPDDPHRFKTSRGKEGAEAIEAVLSDERLSTRFRLFEKYTLPSIIAQTDKNFRIIILASALLPAKWRERLDYLTRNVPQISVHYGKPQPVGQFLNAVLPELAPDEWRTTFRLDDDDGLAEDYIERLHEIARPEFCGMCVSFPRTVHIEDDGQNTPVFYPVWTAKHSAGLAYIGKPGKEKTVYSAGSHTRVDEHQLTIIDSRFFSAARLFHSFNDHPYEERKRKKARFDKERFERRIGGNFSYLFPE